MLTKLAHHPRPRPARWTRTIRTLGNHAATAASTHLVNILHQSSPPRRTVVSVAYCSVVYCVVNKNATLKHDEFIHLSEDHRKLIARVVSIMHLSTSDSHSVKAEGYT